MPILVNETSRVVIQGITGREGVVRAQLMKDYGTKLVAGVTPGRGGQDVDGMPVFDSVAEAWEKHGPDRHQRAFSYPPPWSRTRPWRPSTPGSSCW